MRERTALVLSGGGARGAYEVGVLRGMARVLSTLGQKEFPFGVLAGTSVGALHAAFLASAATRPDFGLAELTGLWRQLDIREHMRPTVTGVWDAFRRNGKNGRLGAHALDPKALETLVSQAIDWGALHRNVDAGEVKAVLVAALDVVNGRTTVFGELAPDHDFRPTVAATRSFQAERLTLAHVLGSAAIPLVFPARKIGNRYYCDGGLRFNTPMSPAIRAGADRLVIISLRANPETEATAPVHEVPTDAFRNPLFLAGKILDALFLDPLAYDLHVLERFNRLLDVLDGALDEPSRQAFERTQYEMRGATYKRIETLVFAPSEDIGRIAGRFLARKRKRSFGSRLRYGLLAHSISGDDDEADLPSYVLFDGEFASELIELGERDALARANDIRDFFVAPAKPRTRTEESDAPALSSLAAHRAARGK